MGRFRNIFLWLDNMNMSNYTATKCGHRTKQTGKVSAFGRTIITKMPKVGDSVEYCLDCLSKMAIQCAWCGGPIFIGDSVTLFSPRDDGFKLPEHAVIYRDNPLQLVGCLRWDCAATGADRAGFWLPSKNGRGYVRRVQSPYEALLATGVPSAVIISDTHNILEN